MQAQDRLPEGIRTTAFAFRGYNVTNLGRTPELLAHPSYGPTVASVLGEASQTCSEVLGRPVDLLARVRSAKETTDLTTYAEDVALIVAVETAQIRYRTNAIRECQTYIQAIRNYLGPEPEGALLDVQACPHDAGTYYTVVCF